MHRDDMQMKHGAMKSGAMKHDDKTKVKMKRDAGDAADSGG